MKFDALLDQQILKEQWLLYRRTLKNVLHNNIKFNFDIDELRSLDATSAVLETSLLSGTILKVHI